MYYYCFSKVPGDIAAFDTGHYQYHNTLLSLSSQKRPVCETIISNLTMNFS